MSVSLRLIEFEGRDIGLSCDHASQCIRFRLVPRRKSCRTEACLLSPEVAVKLSIKAELTYQFADATQIIANIEASHTADQSILSETLDIQPPAKVLSDKTAYGERRIRASLSGDVNIRYEEIVDNNGRRLFPKSGRQHLGW